MKNDKKLVDQAVKAARRIVEKNFSKIGIAASVAGYPQVWSRDSNITFLGAALRREPKAMAAFKVTLETLAKYQDRFGQAPCLVQIADGSAEYGSSDGTSWFVIGSAYYAGLSGDKMWVAKHAPSVIRALDWCESMDLKRKGLMVSGECADWADLIANHGFVLFPNVLYAHALAVGADMLEASHPKEAARFRNRRKTVVRAIQRVFWVRMPGAQIEDPTHEKAQARAAVNLRRKPYFLPWVDGFSYGDRFDTTANLLAVITGLADKEQSGAILDYIEQTGLNRPYPVRVLHPPIMPGESDWREYYRSFNLNMPDQYHNGGIWPWVGGLYVAALVAGGRRRRAEEEIVMLAEALHEGKEEWECNEWLHGLTGKAMGAKYQAWSAGMFLYAEHAVRTGKTQGLSA